MKRRYLLLFLAVPVVLIIFSNLIKASPGSKVGLWVDGLTEEFMDWTTEAGSSPYLHGVEGSNYIQDNADDTHYEGNFTFQDSSELGVINDVKICLYAMNDAGDNGQIEVFITNSTGEYSVAYYVPNGGSYTWTNTSIKSTLPTWTEINNAQMRLRGEREGGADILSVDASLIEVDYTSPQKPQFGTPAINDTGEVFEGEGINHTVSISGSPSVDGYIFSWNASGSCDTWTNSSWIDVSGSVTGWNLSIIPIGCNGKTIGYKFYANNTAGWNSSSISTYPVYAYGHLEVDWLSSSAINSTACQESDPCDWSQYSTKTANATVTCRDGACGTVKAAARYNSSGSLMTLISTTEGDSPFYLMGVTYPDYDDRTCGDTWGVSCDGGGSGSFDDAGLNLTGGDCPGEENNAAVQQHNVKDASVNASVVLFGGFLEASCSFMAGDFGGDEDQLHMWYYNGSEWNEPPNTVSEYNRSVVFQVNNIEGEHRIRCAFCNLYTVTDFCADQIGEIGCFGTYDNDDVNFTVGEGFEPDNPQDLGTLNQDESAQANWTVNLTGSDDTWRIDMNFSSSYSSVLDNNTDDAFVSNVSVVVSYPCPYTSGDWELDCKWGCTNSSINVTKALRIYSTAPGTLNLTSINITQYFEINATHDCTVYMDDWRFLGGT
jgi:hypothetical protein